MVDIFFFLRMFKVELKLLSETEREKPNNGWPVYILLC